MGRRPLSPGLRRGQLARGRPGERGLGDQALRPAGFCQAGQQGREQRPGRLFDNAQEQARSKRKPSVSASLWLV